MVFRIKLTWIFFYYYTIEQFPGQKNLTINNTVLSDPMDDSIRPYTFSRNVNLWISLCFGDMYTYATVCFYTKEEFRNYRALDSYNYFYSGKGRIIETFRSKIINFRCSGQPDSKETSQALSSCFNKWSRCKCSLYMHGRVSAQ